MLQGARARQGRRVALELLEFREIQDRLVLLDQLLVVEDSLGFRALRLEQVALELLVFLRDLLPLESRVHRDLQVGRQLVVVDQQAELESRESRARQDRPVLLDQQLDHPLRMQVLQPLVRRRLEFQVPQLVSRAPLGRLVIPLVEMAVVPVEEVEVAAVVEEGPPIL